MPMPMVDIGHVIVLVFLGGMFMLVRVDSSYFLVSMSVILMAVAMFVD